MEKRKTVNKLLYNKRSSFVSFKGKYNKKLDQVRKKKIK